MADTAEALLTPEKVRLELKKDFGTPLVDFASNGLVEPMLALRLSMLEIRFKAVAPLVFEATDPKESDIALARQVTAGLKEFATLGSSKVRYSNNDLWNKAYHLERLVALLQPSDVALVELKKRSEIATDQRLESAARLKKGVEELDDEIKNDATKVSAQKIRLLLLDALEDEHWAAQKKFSSQPMQTKAIRLATFFVFAAATVFVAPYIWIYCSEFFGYAFDGNNWRWFALFTALSAGLFGAFFSRLAALQSTAGTLTLDALAEAQQPMYMVFRGIVGMSGALFVFFFLQSGMIKGNLFPQFNDLGMTKVYWTGPSTAGPQNGHGAANASDASGLAWDIILPTESLALLIVWSFLAGFSERLVPNILSSTDRTLTEASQRRLSESK